MNQRHWQDVVSAVQEHGDTVATEVATRALALRLIRQLHNAPLDDEEVAEVFSRLQDQEELPRNVSEAKALIATEVENLRNQNENERNAVQEIPVHMLPDDLQAVIATNRRAGHTRSLSADDLAALSDDQRMTLGLLLSARESQHRSATDGDASLALALTIADMSEAELAAFERQQAHQTRTAASARTPASTRQSTDGIEVHTLPEDLQVTIAIHRSLQEHAPHLNEQDLAALSDEQRMQLGLFLSSQSPPRHHAETDGDEALAHAIGMGEAEWEEIDHLQESPAQATMPRRAISTVWEGIKLWELKPEIQDAVIALRAAADRNSGAEELIEADYIGLPEEMKQSINTMAFLKQVEGPAYQIIPDQIRYGYHLNGSMFDVEELGEVLQRWKTAAELLSHSGGEDRQSENLNQPEREFSFTPIPPHLDWSRFVIDENPDRAGGDCMFHALAGTTLTGKEILAIRKDVAEIRSSGQLRNTPGADQNFPESENNQKLRGGLRDTAALEESILDEFIPRSRHISDKVYAAFQAGPGFYEEIDTIPQWTLVEGNEMKKVLCLDFVNGEASLFQRGKKLEITEPITEEYIRRHIAEDEVNNRALKNSGAHWQCVGNATVTDSE